jgi:NADH:ubiquinone oxidoreductase subunit 5 (subunit L)/multisubunit Na+/H+ antiporter MnhA subunit
LGLGQHIDGLSITILVVVAFISSLVQIYSTEYLHGDRRYTHFFASLTLFSAGMLNMVVAENMIQLILGWELMGLCSFMLIGHWWEEGANSRAALKAFFTTRTGDIGLLVGTSVLFFAANDWTQKTLGVSTIDRLIGNLGANDGERAEYIWQKAQESDNPEGYIRGMTKRGLVTPEVMRQINIKRSVGSKQNY